MPWAEAYALAFQAFSDPRTRVGAASIGLVYPISFNDLAVLVVANSLIGDGVRPLYPIQKTPDSAVPVDSVAIDAAQRELEESVVFAN